MLIIFLASCSMNPALTEKLNLQEQLEDTEGRYLNIPALYKKFPLTPQNINDLFKQPISYAGYQRYRKLINDKSEKIQNLNRHRRFFLPRILYQEKISKRKKKFKEEWLWKGNKTKKLFYNSFKNPRAIYEVKVAYQLKEENTPSKNNTSLKKEATNSNIVLYFYRKKHSNDIYLIDSEIFLKSVL